MTYGLIGDPVRWSNDLRRGDTWSILLAYIVEGYLPYTSIKKGFFNADDFVSWVTLDYFVSPVNIAGGSGAV